MKSLFLIPRRHGKTLAAHNHYAETYKVLTARLESHGFTVAYFGIQVNKGAML